MQRSIFLYLVAMTSGNAMRLRAGVVRRDEREGPIKVFKVNQIVSLTK